MTWVFDAGATRVVVKRMGAERNADRFALLFEELARLEPPLAPRLLGTLPASGGEWYALFEHVASAGDGRAGDGAGQVLVELLGRLRAAPVAATGWPVEKWWLDRVDAGLAGDPSAAAVVAWLRANPPAGEPVLVHGDLQAPNVVHSPDGPILVDWEEVGTAPDGFDAGWLLALARLGAVQPWTRERLWQEVSALGTPDSNLWWFERLGLLRAWWRVRTLPIDPPTRAWVSAVVAQAVRNEATFLTSELNMGGSSPCCSLSSTSPRS